MKLLEIKKQSRHVLKKNYYHIIAVVFFIAFITGSFNIFTKNHFRLTPVISSNINFDSYRPTRGVVANIINNATNSGSFIFGLVNSLNELLFHNHIWQSIIILIGTILSFIYWFYLRNAFIVGEKRFFLENKNHSKTKFLRILLPFKTKKNLKVSITMFYKIVLEYLWYFTIVGGFIKHYEYYLVPYILAENPEIPHKDALNLSKNLMKGFKWQVFKFDLSFLGWHLLDILTFHFLGILFVTPYKECAKTEIYFKLREIGRKNNIKNIEYLKDLELDNIIDKYPSDKYLYEEKKTKKWLHTDYNKNYSLTSMILMFFAASFVGWLWEVGLNLFQYGFFANRGTLYGPWLQIYGWGLILILIVLKKYREDPIKTFFLIIILCGILEYSAAWYLETFKHARWWDYDGFFLNIHGRICFEGLITFGLAGTFFIYFAAPFLDSLYMKIPKNIKTILCIILCTLFIIDFGYSSKHPNIGNGIAEQFTKNTTVIKNL